MDYFNSRSQNKLRSNMLNRKIIQIHLILSYVLYFWSYLRVSIFYRNMQLMYKNSNLEVLVPTLPFYFSFSNILLATIFINCKFIWIRLSVCVCLYYNKTQGVCKYIYQLHSFWYGPLCVYTHTPLQKHQILPLYLHHQNQYQSPP